MDYTLFGSLVLFTLVGGVTPGPNNLILMSQGLGFGFRKCIPYIIGVAVGFALLLSAAILGLGAIIAGFPNILKAVTLIGALWLSWLAWGYLKAVFAAPAAVTSKQRARPLGFFESVAFQWVNPKGLIFALGAAAGYVGLHPNLWVRLIVIVVTFNVAGAIGNIAWAAAGGALSHFMSAGRWSKILNAIMGAVIFATALFILYSGFAPKA